MVLVIAIVEVTVLILVDVGLYRRLQLNRWAFG